MLTVLEPDYEGEEVPPAKTALGRPDLLPTAQPPLPQTPRIPGVDYRTETMRVDGDADEFLAWCRSHELMGPNKGAGD